ncbi:YtxH domain-containing protein [Angustibacter luteus]|uniref:YtxH domain-containing protein n=1 Tax=Angustibacter luteus TaxID=658456 RepID=A0ABW1JCL0_9ACTN
MKGKLLLATGVAVGYVLGSRSGRRSYEELKGQAKDFWDSPTVQEQVEQAKAFAREQAPVVQEQLTAAAKRAVDRATSS